MTRGTWTALALALAVALGVTTLGLQAARRDRTALLAAFTADHLARVRFTAREGRAELEEIWRDLELAARLGDAAPSTEDGERDLQALLAVGHGYRRLGVYDAAGRRVLSVVDPLVPAGWSSGPFERALDDTARRAAAGRTSTESPILAGVDSEWYRAFAMSQPGGGAVVLLVDLREALESVRVLSPDRPERLVLLGPDGGALLAPAHLAGGGAHPAPDGALARLLASMRAGESGSVALSSADAVALGLGSAGAIAAFAPFEDGANGRWALAVLEPTDILASKERVITLQIASLAATLAVAFTALAAFLIVHARRATVAQERLREAEQVAHHREKAEKILENVPVAVIAVDEGGKVSALNRTARATVPPTALGEPLASAFPAAAPEALGRLLAAVADARATRAVHGVVGTPLALAGAGTFLAVHVVPLEHPVPDVSLLVVLTDLTEQRALTSQLLRAEKLATVGVLAAGIAHEVGTPLGVVRGRAERIAEKLGAGHRQASDASTIVEEIDRISRTIRALLDYSRPSAPTTVPVPLPEVARTVSALLALEARARGVSLALDLPGDLPLVAADRDQLQQVLVNVVLNGVHACAPGGRVTLRAAPGSGGTLSIVAEDDGAGIPDELRARVFDPFFTTKKRGEGTGLGLTLAAQIVHGHRGDIDLESAVGRGTRVRIAWPLAEAGGGESHG